VNVNSRTQRETILLVAQLHIHVQDTEGWKICNIKIFIHLVKAYNVSTNVMQQEDSVVGVVSVAGLGSVIYRESGGFSSNKLHRTIHHVHFHAMRWIQLRLVKVSLLEEATKLNVRCTYNSR